MNRAPNNVHGGADYSTSTGSPRAIESSLAGAAVAFTTASPR